MGTRRGGLGQWAADAMERGAREGVSSIRDLPHAPLIARKGKHEWSSMKTSVVASSDGRRSTCARRRQYWARLGGTSCARRPTYSLWPASVPPRPLYRKMRLSNHDLRIGATSGGSGFEPRGGRSRATAGGGEVAADWGFGTSRHVRAQLHNLVDAEWEVADHLLEARVRDDRPHGRASCFDGLPSSEEVAAHVQAVAPRGGTAWRVRPAGRGLHHRERRVRVSRSESLAGGAEAGRERRRRARRQRQRGRQRASVRRQRTRRRRQSGRQRVFVRR